MERRSRVSLDNPILQARMRPGSFRPYVDSGRRMAGMDILPARHVEQNTEPQPAAIPVVKPIMMDIAHPPQQESFQRIRTQATPPKTEINEQTKHLPRQSRSHVLKRQMIKKAAKIRRAKHRRPLLPTLLTALAVFLFTAGVFVLISTLKTDHTVKAQVKQLAKQTEDDGITDAVPSEDEPPSNSSSYNVAPDLPRFFTIEKLGVHARVKRLGVSADNVLKAPANIFDVGWYDGSAKPGENGTIVLDGHVSGPTKHGVFYSIGSLKQGDKVQLERGDGKVFTYTVTGTQVYDYDKVDMPKVLTSSIPGKAALNFMTCTGRFNVRTNSFEQRVVVFTTQDQ